MMRSNSSKWFLIAALILVCVPAARAQDQEEEQKGIDQDNYNIRQSIEFGGRITSLSGDTQAYDTFVNLQQGPRLLGFTTDMTSLNHSGMLFDRLHFSNFGYGGDPNNVSRLRVSKDKWYNFDGMFRRDVNSWDYSLQANPLNPTTPFANGPAGYGGLLCTACVLTRSPHLFDTRRRLSDYNLLVMPQSKVRFRAGYSRNIVEGPAFSTIHQGTEEFLLSHVKTTVNTYRIGTDIRVLPRTNISYDQLWTYYKGDTGQIDAAQPFPLSPTQNVDLGVSFNAAANQPCKGTFLATGFVNPTCSAYFNYQDNGRTRTKTPTEQLSMQSNYWKNVDLSARLSYSTGTANVFGYNQTLFGLESRTGLSNQTTRGPVFGKRSATAADLGATWHITDKLSFLDSFHYSNWHDPMAFDGSSCSFFSPNLTTAATFFTPTVPVPLTCVPPAGVASGTPAHSGSSAADITIALSSNFLKQDEKTNLAELEYRFSPRLGARGGFRARHRAIDAAYFSTTTEVFYPNNANRGDCSFLPPPAPPNTLPPGCNPLGTGAFEFNTPGPVSTPVETLINEYSGVFGIWARPITNWRISFDMELMSADNAFTRVSPRQTQEYRVRSSYKAANWLSLNGTVAIWEGRNNVTGTNDLQHNRAYGISALIQPTDRYALELGYDYNDVFSQVLICYVSSNAPPISPGVSQCPNVTGLIQQLSTYTNKSSYGYFDLRGKPISHLTAHLGANLTGTSGSQLRLDPMRLIPDQVTGSLNSKWLHPYGGLDYNFNRYWTGKAYWDYYGYHEDPTAGAVQDIYAPRNFRGNLITLSARFAF